MMKCLIGAAALFAASPAMAHVGGAPMHAHGFETVAVGAVAIALAAIVWWVGSRLGAS